MSDNLPKVEASENSVIIKIPKERISDFLGDFLKTKRQISKRFPVIFNIDKDDINNIISVLQYRIKEQSNASLVDVSIDVLYDDGSDRNYTTLESFMNLDDNLSAVSVAVFVKLSYLIAFREDDMPTKQDINIYATSKDMGTNWLPSSSVIVSNLIISITTNRFTWAEDIINHLSNYVKGRFSEVDRFTKFINYIYFSRSISGLIFSLVPIVALVFFMLFLNESVDRIRDNSADYSHLVGINSMEHANRKLDILLTRANDKDFKLFESSIVFKYALYFLSFVVIFLILPIIYALSSSRTYISIGRTSKQINSKRISRSNTIKYSIIGGALVSMLASLFANYITNLF